MHLRLLLFSLRHFAHGVRKIDVFCIRSFDPAHDQIVERERFGQRGLAGERNQNDGREYAAKSIRF